MKKKMISYTLDSLPTISDERWRELEAMATRPDEEIDTSDIPEITPEQAKHAVRGWQNHPGRRASRGKNAA